MESFKEIIRVKNQKKTKKSERLLWQQIALEIIEFTSTPKNQHSAVFKTCKQNLSSAQRSFIACKELNKPFIKYYFKVFNEYNKDV